MVLDREDESSLSDPSVNGLRPLTGGPLEGLGRGRERLEPSEGSRGRSPTRDRRQDDRRRSPPSGYGIRVTPFPGAKPLGCSPSVRRGPPKAVGHVCRRVNPDPDRRVTPVTGDRWRKTFIKSLLYPQVSQDVSPSHVNVERLG